MTSNSAFKVCVLISACAHTALLYPWAFSSLVTAAARDASFKKIELTYVRNPVSRDKAGEDAKFDASMDYKRKKESPAEPAVKIETSEVFIPPVAEAYHEVKVNFKDDLPPAEENQHARSMKEEYCLRVREKIKSALEKNCRGYVEEGEVYVKFAVDRNGSLKDLTLYKTSGQRTRLLEEITLKSIKEASPFPSFSEEMHETELLFRQPIQITSRP